MTYQKSSVLQPKQCQIIHLNLFENFQDIFIVECQRSLPIGIEEWEDKT